MLTFDEKLLITVICVLVVGITIKLSMPQIQEGLNLDLILFGTSGFGLMIYFHHVGFIEGYAKGVEHGKTEMRKI